MDKAKRDRSANFSTHTLVQKYQTVLENKQSDASTWKMKETAWESIQSEFNARSGSIFRSTKTLKVKYEGLKRAVRKKSAAIRSELYRTGGGKNTAPPLDNVEEKIKAMIALSTDGLEGIYDSDVLPQNLEIQDAIDVSKTEELGEIPLLHMNADVESKPTENQVLLLVTNDCEPLPPTTSAETVPGDFEVMNNVNEAVPDTLINAYAITPTTSASKKWDVTSRKNLKSRKHPALIANVPKKSQFDELTQAKLELVQIQKELLDAEIAEKKKSWELIKRSGSLKKRSGSLKKRSGSLKKRGGNFMKMNARRRREFKEKEREFNENERKKEAEFKENERKKEAEFKEKERKWKEEEYKLRLQYNFK